jgi:hypothetical protein
VPDDRIDLLTGEDDRDIWFLLSPDDAVDLTKLLAQYMPEEEKESVEGLVLG